MANKSLRTLCIAYKKISESDDVNSVVDSDLFNSMCIPESPVIGNEISWNGSISCMRLDVRNSNKKWNPIVLWRAFCVCGLEVFSINVVSAVTNVHQEIELLLSVWCKEVIFWFVRESDSSSALVKDWVCGFDCVQSQISELGKKELVCFSESSVWVEVFDFGPVFNVFFVADWVESLFVNLQKSSLSGTSIEMGFKIDIDQERNKPDLELEVMNVVVESVLDFGDPFFIKASEMIDKFLRNDSVRWMIPEIGQSINAINVRSLDCENWL